MFADCQLMGMDLAFPDICKTPPALLPIPYPNFALGPMAIPTCWNVLLMCMPAHNLLTTIPLTNGDNAGLALGLISQTVMAQSRRITCVPNVLFGCIPATRLTSLTVQNTINTVGMRVVPSQLKVLLLGGGGGGARSGRGGAGGAAGKGPGGSSASVARTGAPKGPGAPRAPAAPKAPSAPKAPAGPKQAPGPRASAGGKPSANARPASGPRANPKYKRGKFRKGVRDKVWDEAEKKSPDGIVRDPVTKKPMKKDDPWDMGHRPGYEHRKHVRSAEERGIDRKQFLDEYNDPSHYRPELPRSNRGHKGEDLTDDYFGP
ncbi:PAAR-like domain-containing protein [Bordetella sp. 2513F-2]